MKNLFILFISGISLFVLAFSTQVSSGKYQNDCASENLKGPVKSCAQFDYDVYKSGNALDSDYKFELKQTFNNYGNCLSFIVTGNLLKKPKSKDIGEFIEYDNEGRELLTKDLSGKIMAQSSYRFNNEHNLVETISFIIHPLKLIYNKEGRRDTMYDITNNGKLISKAIYHYNQKLDETEEIHYDDNGNLEYKIVYAYDNNHHNIEKIMYGKSLTDSNKMTYAYDNLGNIIMERDTSTTYYDGGNRPFSIDPTDKNYKIFKCKYSNFDSHKNWLRQDMFYNDTIAKTVKRVIEYYP